MYCPSEVTDHTEGTENSTFLRLQCRFAGTEVSQHQPHNQVGGKGAFKMQANGHSDGDGPNTAV